MLLSLLLVLGLHRVTHVHIYFGGVSYVNVDNNANIALYLLSFTYEYILELFSCQCIDFYFIIQWQT